MHKELLIHGVNGKLVTEQQETYSNASFDFFEVLDSGYNARSRKIFKILDTTEIGTFPIRLKTYVFELS